MNFLLLHDRHIRKLFLQSLRLLRQLSESIVDIVILVAAHLIDISFVFHFNLLNLGFNAVLVVSLDLLHLLFEL